MALKSNIETDRLILRCITPSDYDIMRHLDIDPVIKKYLGPAVDENATQERMIKIQKTNIDGQGLGYWMGEIKETKEAIGWYVLNNLDGGLLIEIGYRLLEKHWGQGYATEGSQALLDYGFNDLNLSHIVGVCNPNNVPSMNVLLKIGLTQKENQHYYNQEVAFFEKHKTT